MKPFEKFFTVAIKPFAILALLIIVAAAPVAAQKKNKKNQTDDSGTNEATLPLPDSAQIDQTVSEFLGYWQIGDADMLHRYYADNAVTVSGAWQPPIIGWTNYLAAYRAQRAHISSSRMDRSNTYSDVLGNTAWVTYQWVFTAVVDGQPSISHGHTSLLLNKQGDRWVIVLNHTSAVDEGIAAPAGTPAAAPGISGPVQTGRP